MRFIVFISCNSLSQGFFIVGHILSEKLYELLLTIHEITFVFMIQLFILHNFRSKKFSLINCFQNLKIKSICFLIEIILK